MSLRPVHVHNYGEQIRSNTERQTNFLLIIIVRPNLYRDEFVVLDRKFVLLGQINCGGKNPVFRRVVCVCKTNLLRSNLAR